MSDLQDRELSLDHLAPERLTFWDSAYGGGGERHEWRMVAELGLEDAGSLRRIQDELARASALVAKATATADELEDAARRLVNGFEAFLRLLLPTLPAERVRAIPLAGKQHMLEWWRARQPRHDQEALSLPLGPAARATPRARRLRGSSPPTA